MTRQERFEIETENQKQNEMWEERQAHCDHEYEIIEDEPIFDGVECVSFPCECRLCGKKAKEVYIFSTYNEEQQKNDN